MATDSNNIAFSYWIAKKQTKSLDDLDELEQYVLKAHLLECGLTIFLKINLVYPDRFPLLFFITIDILSITAMFFETELIFSGAKYTISYKSSSLHIKHNQRP